MAKTGTVKWFNAQEGYGFIARDDGSEDTYVHVAAVKQGGLETLREGQRVSFDVEAARGGKQLAVNLRVAQ